MKEFIDKLISRLDEYKRKHRGSDFHYHIASNDIIEIVNELAEEYKGGWIPCSEKQPNKDGYFLITTSDGEVDVREYDYGNGLGWDGFERIIAWQPIAPYTEGE